MQYIIAVILVVLWALFLVYAPTALQIPVCYGLAGWQLGGWFAHICEYIEDRFYKRK